MGQIYLECLELTDSRGRERERFLFKKKHFILNNDH